MSPSAESTLNPLQKPSPSEFAPFYAGYVAKARSPLLAKLADEAEEWRELLRAIPADSEGHRYAPGKWSIREVAGHVVDTERILCARALAFARGDASPYPSFDQDAYAHASQADERRLADLSEELVAVRRATVLLFQGLPKAAWSRRGIAGGNAFTVRSLAWIIAGHSRHHRQALMERYRP